jgi:hypothetical protein
MFREEIRPRYANHAPAPTQNANPFVPSRAHYRRERRQKPCKSSAFAEFSPMGCQPFMSGWLASIDDQEKKLGLLFFSIRNTFMYRQLKDD